MIDERGNLRSQDISRSIVRTVVDDDDLLGIVRRADDGINQGANMGDDTLYSGTVAAAMEGYLFGIPAIAFSQVEKGWGHLDAAARKARELVQYLSANHRTDGAHWLLNVNIPNRASRKRCCASTGCWGSAGWEGSKLTIAVNVTVEEVKRDPESVIHRVLEGETLVLTEHDRPIAEIRPIERVRRPRPFGLAAGTFVVPDDFDDPLPEEILRDFEQ